MDLRQILIKGGVLVIDPSMLKITPDEFLAKYGSYMDTVCLVAKAESGATYYPSFTAPKDPQYGEFFSSFAQIASDIGIKVFAQIHANIDHYLSRDANFGMARSGGSPIQGYICPARQPYAYYLSEIALEIAKYPVDGIILKDAVYPQRTCFCESCRREFVEEEQGLDREFSYERLETRPEILNKWYLRRLRSLTNMLGTVINRVISQRRLDFLTEILIEPAVNYLQGATSFFAQDVNYLSQVSSHMLLHISPFTEPLPEPDSVEFDNLVNALSPIRERQGTLNNSLFFWGGDEKTMDIAETLRGALGSQNIFLFDGHPPSYGDRRSYHLGLF